MKSFQLLFLFVLLTYAKAVPSNVTYEVIFEWKQLAYDFENSTDPAFIPRFNIPTGIKVDTLNNRLYLTVLKCCPGVPAAIVYADFDPTAPTGGSPLLKPYPSWEMQEIGNCDAFQFIQSMEIDQYNRMWILDTGRTSTELLPIVRCPPRLFVVDLNNDQIIRTHHFAQELADPETNLLNDVVVACHSPSDCWAYITNSGEGKLIVYNWENDDSWAAHHVSMEVHEDATTFPIFNVTYNFEIHIDGIALSNIDNNFDVVYYTPLSSYNLYSVLTEVLKQKPVGGLVIELEDSQVTTVGRRSSHTDGMAIDSNGFLHYGSLLNSTINSWDTSESTFPTPDGGHVVVGDDVDLQWPDTFSFDNQGYVYATTNRLHQFSHIAIDPEDVNYRVVRYFTGTKSYMHTAERL